jgi:uncharacterized protein YkwD
MISSITVPETVRVLLLSASKEIFGMSQSMQRRAFIGHIAFWPLMARRSMVTPTYNYTYGQLPPGYTYVTAQSEQVVQQPEQVQTAAATEPTSTEPQQTVYDYGDGGLLASMNSLRASAGLHALAYDASLSASAQGVAANCAASNSLIHSNLGMENLAMAGAPAQAASMWANSPGHRANMFSGATRVGIGLSTNGGYWFIAAIFG